MTDHTPTPWEAGGVTKDRYVVGDGGEGIFELGDVNIFPPMGETGPVAIVSGADNAAFIVKACNEHEALRRRVACLEMIIREDLHPDDCRDEANRMIVEELCALPSHNRSTTGE